MKQDSNKKEDGEQDPTVAFRLKRPIRDFYRKKAIAEGVKLSKLLRDRIEQAWESDQRASKRKAA